MIKNSLTDSSEVLRFLQSQFIKTNFRLFFLTKYFFFLLILSKNSLKNQNGRISIDFTTSSSFDPCKHQHNIHI